MSCACATSLGSALILAVVLTGCSDLYTDRRDTIALSAGDAVATDKMTHMVDPWPRASANRDIAFDGQRMQSAVQRYRTNKVIRPVNPATSTAGYQQAQPAAAASSGKP